jgi:hypothetical protein
MLVHITMLELTGLTYEISGMVLVNVRPVVMLTTSHTREKLANYSPMSRRSVTYPRPPGCLRCLPESQISPHPHLHCVFMNVPTRPCPADTWPRCLRVLVRRVGILTLCCGLVCDKKVRQSRDFDVFSSNRLSERAELFSVGVTWPPHYLQLHEHRTQEYHLR